MDLTIDVEDYKLNVRAGGIIIHNNKLLAHKDKDLNFYALLGGRIAIGEDSKETLKREIKEEIEKEVEITGYIGTIENFFEINGQKYHEIEIVHKAEFVDEKDKKLEENLINAEGKENLVYEWIELDRLEEYNLMPVAIKEALIQNEFPVHKVQRD